MNMGEGAFYDMMKVLYFEVGRFEHMGEGAFCEHV